MNGNKPHEFARRQVVKTSAAVGIGAAVAMRLGSIVRVRAAQPTPELLRVGLVGCGGRGTGATLQALQAAPNVKLVAMGDLFKDRLDGARKMFAEKNLGEAFGVTDDKCFSGWDAYQKVIDSGVDYVILASPPGFRPIHLKAAVDAGKHIFTEKPMAVDAPGIRTCFELAAESEKKGLAVGVGLQRHHHSGYLDLIKRIRGGAIGEVLAGRCYWLQGPLWMKARQPQWSDVEWQVRNWLYFTYLSGDQMVEQHIHNIDVMNWAIGKPAVAAVATGGRQVRTEAAYGHVFDHFGIDFEYPNEVHVLSACRQIAQCHNDVSEHVVGSKGTASTANRRFSINWRGKTKWMSEAQSPDPYLQEHRDLIESIRRGKPYNELKNATESNMTAILGRMAAYTGQRVTWEQALASNEVLMPANLAFEKKAVPEIAMPGKTQLL